MSAQIIELFDFNVHQLYPGVWRAQRRCPTPRGTSVYIGGLGRDRRSAVRSMYQNIKQLTGPGLLIPFPERDQNQTGESR